MMNFVFRSSRPGLFLVLLVSALILVTWSCKSRENAGEDTNAALTEHAEFVDTGKACIEFDTLVHNFGSLAEGEMVYCYFTYRNTGSKELVITEVESSCGCTAPEWDHSPLEPGKPAELKVLFDSSGKEGKQVKRISISSNGSETPVLLTIIAEVN